MIYLAISACFIFVKQYWWHEGVFFVCLFIESWRYPESRSLSIRNVFKPSSDTSDTEREIRWVFVCVFDIWNWNVELAISNCTCVAVQQMYGGSNGAMKQSSMTTLPRGCTQTAVVGGTATLPQGNWLRPAGPLGYRTSTLARVLLYCLAKWDSSLHLIQVIRT